MINQPETSGVRGEKPRRIQLSRKKGSRMPPNTVKVDRTTKWGNPFSKSILGVSSDWSVRMFRRWLKGKYKAGAVYATEHGAIVIPNRPSANDIASLKGKNLACWCKPGEPCHADVLLEIANAEAV